MLRTPSAEDPREISMWIVRVRTVEEKQKWFHSFQVARSSSGITRSRSLNYNIARQAK